VHVPTSSSLDVVPEACIRGFLLFFLRSLACLPLWKLLKLYIAMHQCKQLLLRILFNVQQVCIILLQK
jgi:hypothetical protein